ncbi:MAG: prephenate/arogenate dehydrogenase family protein [Methylobacteriaceae bacterium]|jgi:cyclohexadieny/prephenate dehydrogenase|nr:prephenate/arogenate dehydrogenase family protein [Methylobacteriaceae bacterium]
MTPKTGTPLVEPLFKRLAIIGFGLIGSSIARVARQQNLVETIVAIDSSKEARRTIRELALADRITGDIPSGVRGADFIILCTPVGSYEQVALAMKDYLEPGAIVSDVGSVKGVAVTAITPHIPPHAHFVAAHPVAGTEQSGPQAGFASLFVNRYTVVTPTLETDREAVAKVVKFWEGTGALVEEMDYQHHDLVLAITSHIPHLIAYNIVGTAADLETVIQSEVIKFSAGGFRDFTRIAASDPTMWRDVFLNNREAVLEMLGRFNEDLSALARAIRWGDGDKLFDLFTRTRSIRRSIIDMGQEIAEPNFGRDKGAN